MVSGESGPATLRNGQTISHFRIIQKLGQGGMGAVYLALDLTLGRQVALKFLKVDGAEGHTLLNRFRLEARAAAALKHPYICTIYGVEECDGQPVIEMEFAEGETLAVRLARGALPLDQALDLTIQIADALSEAHRMGIVHRDLKPANIMLTKFGPKVLDFGLAKMEGTEPGSVAAVEPGATQTVTMSTLHGTILGTPHYMSPEQAAGEKADSRADLFSLGVVLYEMVTGARPFNGSSTMAVLSSVMKDTPAPPTALNADLPSELNSILGMALEKDRSQRYQSAGDFRDACAELRQMPPRHAARGGGMLKRRSIWMAIGGAALLCVAATGWVLLTQKAHALSGTDTVVVADFGNTTGDAVFDDALKEALSAQLKQSPFINLLPDERVFATLKLMGRPRDSALGKDAAREVCLRTGSRAYISGSIVRLGTQYAITLLAIDCQSTDVMARTQEIAKDKDQVLRALDAAAKSLREKVGEAVSSVERFATPLDQVTTPSLEALKSYSLGRKAMRSGDPLGSIPLFQWAVRLDPNFAMAHLSMGMNFWGLNETVKGMESMRRAYELRERVSEWERFAIESRYHFSVTGDLHQARRTYEAWGKAYPREAIALSNQAQIQSTLGNHEQATVLIRQSVQISLSSAHITFLGTCLTLLDRFDEAKTTLNDAIQKRLDHADVHKDLYRIAFAERDKGSMAQQVAWAAGKPGVEQQLVFLEAQTAANAGHVKEARRLANRASAMAQEDDEKEVAAGYEGMTAIQEALYGNASEARQRAAAALRSAHSRDVEYTGALALASAGQPKEAERIAADLSQQYPSDTVAQFVCLPLIRAKIAMGHKEHAKALEILEPARRYELGYEATLTPSIYVSFVRGEALLASGRADEAAAEFQKVLSHRGITGNDPVGPLAQLNLARVHAFRHDLAKAREAYQAFFELWKEADPDIPILREARKEWSRLR